MIDITNTRPLGDRVLICKVEEKERTFGSIVIPQTANEIDLSWTADVIAVGPGRALDNGTVIPSDVKPGDQVMVEKYLGDMVKIDGKEYFMVRSRDILGIVEA